MDRRFSEQEARQIFALAAERAQAAQAHTADTLSLHDLEEAGRAAGLDPAFIHAAAADFLRPDGRLLRRTVAGLPVELRRTRVLPGRLDDDTWAEVVAACRRRFGRHGVVTDLGRTREWASEADERQMPYRVLVEEDGDGLRVTIGRRTGTQALGLGIASGVNLVVGLVFLVTWLVASAANPLWIPALVVTAAGLLIGAGAYAGLHAMERRDRRRIEEAFADVERLTAPAPSTTAPSTTAPSTTAPSTTARPTLDLDAADPEASPEADAARAAGRRTRA